ncbi:gluconokinase [soil metagenome]
MGVAPQVVIGVDIGTTATKVVAYASSGRARAESSREYPLEASLPYRAEQDPDLILDAVLGCLHDVTARCSEQGDVVSGIAMSAAMHGVIALDGRGALLTPLITWADNRAAEQARILRERSDGLDIYRRTGTPLHPMSPLAKLLWFEQESKEVWRRAAWWISIKEYVLYRLFGELVVDHSIASATGLFNLERLDWDDGVLALLDLSRDKLPALVPTTHVLAGMDVDCARRTGLPVDTPFVVGASDGVLANLGVGAIRPGIAACTIGTSGAVRMCSTRPRTDPRGRIFCYALTEDLWVVGGPINNGGVALQWLRDEIFPAAASAAEDAGREPYDDLLDLAATAAPGSDGLIFLPYLLGERAPYWDARARAAFVGLTIRHSREHVVRAVMEGVVYQLHAVLAVLETVAGEAIEFRATGGFSRSSLWRQIMADIFGSNVAFPRDHESSCLGAAILGMATLGLIDSIHRCEDLVVIEHRHEPVAGNGPVYGRLTEVFGRLYEKLAPEFDVLAKLQLSADDAFGG